MLTREHLTGVLLGVLVLGVAVVVHHGVPPAVDTRRTAFAPVFDGPGLDLVDGARLAAGRTVPVRTAPYGPADFRCRSGGSLSPVIPTSYVSGRCSVALRPAVGSRSTVQLVRVDAAGAVVEEYPAITLHWTEPGPDGD